MKGPTWEPVPGIFGVPIPVEIRDNGTTLDGDEDDERQKQAVEDEEEMEVKLKTGQDRFHTSRKAIERYGTTAGCPACTAIEQGKHLTNPYGRLGHNHNETCMERVRELMIEDPQYRHLIQRHRSESEPSDVAAVTNLEAEIDVISSQYHEERVGQVRKAMYNVEQKIHYERRIGIWVQFDQTMFKMLIASMEVAEFYSLPRVIERERTMGMKAGWSFDLTTIDTDGRAWNFNEVEMRNRAVRNVLVDKPLLLIGSTMCIVYSSMNRINHSRVSEEEVNARFRYAREHFEFSAKLYQMQIHAWRYFLHEHPHAASSWQETCIQRILNCEGVMKVVGDQCRYGLTTRDKEQEGWARKRIGSVTHLVHIAQQLGRKRPNRGGYVVHQHIRLEGGRPEAAQVYPKELCRAICLGIQNQIKVDERGQSLSMGLGGTEATSKDLMNVAEDLRRKCKTAGEPDNGTAEKAWDGVSGAELDPNKVRQARAEEIEYVHKMKLYEKRLTRGSAT